MGDSKGPNTWAVIVGINFYFGDGKISNLKGCVEDANGFERIVQDHLRSKGIPEAEFPTYVTKLTSTANQSETGAIEKAHADAVVGSATKQSSTKPLLATYRNIVQALFEIPEKAARGDRVIFTYSGHGHTVPSLLRGREWINKDSKVGNDETLVPCNAFAEAPGESNGGMIRDFELNWLFQRIVKQGLSLTVILDSCSSGGVARAPDKLPLGYAERSIKGELVTDQYISLGKYLSSSPLRQHFGELESAWKEVMSRTENNRPLTWPLKPLGYTFLAAALAHEKARELYGRGCFTEAFTDAYKLTDRDKSTAGQNTPVPLTIRDILRYIYDGIYRDWSEGKRASLQTPLALGNIDRTLFEDVAILKPNRLSSLCIPVRAIPDKNLPTGSPRKLVIRYGEAHGAQLDSEFILRLWDEINEDTPKSSVRAILTELGSVSSVISVIFDSQTEKERFAKVAEAEQALWTQRQMEFAKQNKEEYDPLSDIHHPWPQGCQALLVSGPLSKAVTVCLVGDIHELGDPNNMYVRGPVALKFVRGTQGGEGAPYRIVAHKSESGYQIQDSKGHPLVPFTYPPESVTTKLLADIIQIEQYRSRALISGPVGDNLNVTAAFTLTPAPFTFVNTEVEALEDPSNTSQTIRLKFTSNKAYRTYTGASSYLNFAVFYFSSRWGIRQIYPTDGAFESIPHGDTRVFSFTRIPPVPSAPEGTEFVKAIVFNSSTTSFQTWEMPDIMEHEGEENIFARFVQQPKLIPVPEVSGGTAKPEMIKSKSAQVDFEMNEQLGTRRWWALKNLDL